MNSLFFLIPIFPALMALWSINKQQKSRGNYLEMIDKAKEVHIHQDGKWQKVKRVYVGTAGKWNIWKEYK